MTEEITSPERLRDAALYYANLGWKILPIWGLTDSGKCACGDSHPDGKNIGKHPVGGNNLARATSDPDILSSIWDGKDIIHNIGVMPMNSGFFVVDIDPRNGGHDSILRFEDMIEGELPPTIEAITGAYKVGPQVLRGRHMLYKLPEGLDVRIVGNLKSQGFDGIDVKHNGYTLLNPSKHTSGTLYQWKPGHAPWEMEMAEAPQKLLDAVVAGAAGGPRAAGASTSYYMSGTSPFDGSTSFGTYDKLDIDKVLTEGVKEGERSNTVYKLTCALANKYGVEDTFKKTSLETMMIRFNAEKIVPPMELEGSDSLLYHVRRAIEFVAANPKSSLLGWDTAEYEEAKKMVSKMTPEELTLEDEDAVETSAGIILQAKTYDPDADYDEESETSTINTDIDVPKDRDALTPEGGAMPGQRSMTDLGNGRRFADNFQNVCRYTPGLGWFYWNKTYWQNDVESLGVRELAKAVAPIIAAEVVHYTSDKEKETVLKWATSTKSSERLSATLKMAGSDPRLVVDVNSWDAYPTLLGVKNGVVDLKTGVLLKGRPDLYITRRTPVEYREGMKDERWEGFLKYGTNGDKEYEEWLQKAVGYTITGMSKLDIMFLIYGPPGTGKNTFIESVLLALGTQDYSWSMDSTILSDEAGSGTSGTDMYHWAELRGRRMVLVDELPDSGRLKENGVKKLTGSSEIPARSPGEKPFTFKSQAKLWISTNHRPIITDDAMWRRLRPVPWVHVPKTPDPGLKDYLSDPDGGLPAVLAWAIEGAKIVLNSTDPDPIGWCTVVREAHDDYKRNEDRIGLFLSETTIESIGGTIVMEDLFRSFSSWAFARNEKGGGLTGFIRKLKDRGETIEGDGNSATMINRLMKGDAEPGASLGIPGVPATQGGKWGGMIAST